MMYPEILAPWLLILLPTWNICYHHKNLLMMALNLEMISISLIILLMLFQYPHNYLSFMTLLVLVTISTCEASILLATLTIMNRKVSSDNTEALMLNLC